MDNEDRELKIQGTTVQGNRQNIEMRPYRPRRASRAKGHRDHSSSGRITEGVSDEQPRKGSCTWQQCCRSVEDVTLRMAKLVSSAERNTMWSRDADFALHAGPYVKDDCRLDFG